jgi:hypothetical protein
MSLWQGGRELKTLVCSRSVKTQVQCHPVARMLSFHEDARLMKVNLESPSEEEEESDRGRR